MMVHGDDFVFVGRRSGREKALEALRSRYEIKAQTVGPCAGMPREMRVLGAKGVPNTPAPASPRKMRSMCENKHH